MAHLVQQEAQPPSTRRDTEQSFFVCTSARTPDEAIIWETAASRCMTSSEALARKVQRPSTAPFVRSPFNKEAIHAAWGKRPPSIAGISGNLRGDFGPFGPVPSVELNRTGNHPVHTKMLRPIVLTAVVAVMATACGGSSTGSSASKLTQTQIIASASKATVHIYGQASGAFFESGTGVVIDAAKGLILTADHVIAGAPAIKVVLPNHSVVAGQVVAQAPCDDLAVLRLNPIPSGLNQIKIVDNKPLAAGAHVTALGFPASVQNATDASAKLVATEGSVSANDIAADPNAVPADLPALPDLIQHQAPINPGNSGGPLVDDNANLVGINVWGNPNGQSQGYAVASNHISTLLPNLKAGKNIQYLGFSLRATSGLTQGEIRYIEQQTGAPVPNDASNGNLILPGLIVTGVDSGSPVDTAQIEVFDFVDGLEGTAVGNVQQVCDVLASKSPGSHVKVNGIYNFANDNYGKRWTADAVLGA